MKKAWYCVLILMLSSCGVTSPGRLDTPNGNPQVTIGKDANTVREATLDWLLKNGYMIEKESDQSVIILRGLNEGVQLTFNLQSRDSIHTTLYAFKYVVIGTTEQTYLSHWTTQETYDELQADLLAIQKNVGG